MNRPATNHGISVPSFLLQNAASSGVLDPRKNKKPVFLLPLDQQPPAANSRIFSFSVSWGINQRAELYLIIIIIIYRHEKPVNTDVYGLFQTPRVGLEPTTPRLTAACSTIELSRIILFSCTFSSVCNHTAALPLGYREPFCFPPVH